MASGDIFTIDMMTTSQQTVSINVDCLLIYAKVVFYNMSGYANEGYLAVLDSGGNILVKLCGVNQNSYTVVEREIKKVKISAGEQLYISRTWGECSARFTFMEL